MARSTTKGKCTLCGNTYSKAGMSRHLVKCLQKNPPKAASGRGQLQKTRLFHLAAQGYYDSDYWLNLEVPATATLEDLDRFLRGIWLECCGHLSAFEIQGQSYVSSVFDSWGNDQDMDVALGSVLRPGLKFGHEYDFGTTTELSLRVVSERVGEVRGPSIQVLARNEPPEIICTECGEKEATQVCTMCIYRGQGWLCDECASDHECGEDYFLPVVNSPRVGMCGYTG